MRICKLLTSDCVDLSTSACF